MRKLRVFAASPADMAAEHAKVEKIASVLKPLADSLDIVLDVVDWRAVVPDMDRSQQVILDQLEPTTWDVFIGILWHRFGTPPGGEDPQTQNEYLAGTEEEFKAAYRLWQQFGKPRIMMYRCTRAVPLDALDPDQFKRVKEFFAQFSAVEAEHPGLYQPFETTEAFETLLLDHLQKLLLGYGEHIEGEPVVDKVVQKLLLGYGEHIKGEPMVDVVQELSGKRPFISYAREDSQTARRLYRDLIKAGAKPWLDSEELIGGQEWEPAVRKAIWESTHFLALTSANSVNKRGFVQKELREALELLDELPPGHIYIIPIRLDNSSPAHERLRSIHWIDLFPEYADGLRHIITSLGISAVSGPTRPPAVDATTADRGGSGVPHEILAKIRARAERDFPNDFSTQKYFVNNEAQAWQQLERFAAPGMPQEVIRLILDHAATRFPEEFSTRLYMANNEVNAWRELQNLEMPGMPVDTLHSIAAKAERLFPRDFSTRLYIIRNEVAAWRELHM